MISHHVGTIISYDNVSTGRTQEEVNRSAPTDLPCIELPHSPRNMIENCQYCVLIILCNYPQIVISSQCPTVHQNVLFLSSPLHPLLFISATQYSPSKAL